MRVKDFIDTQDFTKEELVKAIEEYNHRHRRFGKVEEA